MNEKPRELLRRPSSIRAFDHGEVTTVLGRDGTAREFRGDSALLVRELLRALVVPRTWDDLLAHLEKVASGVKDAIPTIEAALRNLREAGAVAVVDASASPARPQTQGRLVLGISGAVAAAHTPALVQKLQARGFEVRVAMTRAAGHFVAAEALRALTHHRVYRGHWGSTPAQPAPHIALAEWADVVLLAPCSATTASRLAQGDCSDLVSALSLSTRAPVIVAPSMNEAMHEAPAIARNLSQLVEDGFYVAHMAMAVEVADAPEHRRPRLGGWPSLDDTVALIEYVTRQSRMRSGSVLTGNAAAQNWEATYQNVPPEQIPFHSDKLDEDVREALQQVKRPASLWDVGTGLGTIAQEAASLGFTALGTDISPAAIALASQKHPDSGARFAVDDVRCSTLQQEFDVVVDRGCFHTLDLSEARAYTETLRRRTHPGSLFLLKIHQEAEPHDWHTVRYRISDLESVLLPDFELLEWSASTFPGSHAPPPRAWFSVWRRR